MVIFESVVNLIVNDEFYVHIFYPISQSILEAFKCLEHYTDCMEDGILRSLIEFFAKSQHQDLISNLCEREEPRN